MPRKTLKEEIKQEWLTQRPLHYDEAFECINKIYEELGEPTISEREFKQVVAQIDIDNNESFTLKEIKDFISRFIHRQEKLLISIYWIGWSVDPQEKENRKTYKRMNTLREGNNSSGKELFSKVRLQVNGDGQLFCLSEWSAMIAAQGPNVHVLLLNDDQHDTNSLKLDMTKQEIV